jgi:adenine phosphoribosyltransferase
MNFEHIIRTYSDFPRKGIKFRDVTPWLQNGPAFVSAINILREKLAHLQIDGVLGPEARGFALGAPLAYALRAGFIPVRKAGKLPGELLEVSYQLEYGEDHLSLQKDSIYEGQQVVLADDLLATGGTMAALCQLLHENHVIPVAAVFMVELLHLNGRKKLPKNLEIISLVQYTS